MEKLVCVAGPTASGKTALAVRLAQELNGEIISADSMQIYRGMNIGTAKPSVEEMDGIPHHMLDVADPSEEYSAARYADEAAAVVDDIRARGRLPIAAGGTGLYINALLGRLSFAEEPRDEALRTRLAEEAKTLGEEAMYARLAEQDPIYARTVHPHNVKRVLRGLEIIALSGNTVTSRLEQAKSVPLRYEPVIIGLCPQPREFLVRRIDQRVDVMMRQGLEREARMLYEKPLSVTAAQAIGYKELFEYFDGVCTLSEAVENIRIHTRQYSKRQLTWFRQDSAVNWVTYSEDMNFALILEKSRDILRKYGII